MLVNTAPLAISSHGRRINFLYEPVMKVIVKITGTYSRDMYIFLEKLM